MAAGQYFHGRDTTAYWTKVSILDEMGRHQYWTLDPNNFWIAFMCDMRKLSKQSNIYHLLLACIKSTNFSSACSVAISAHQILVIGGQPHDDEIEAHRSVFATFFFR